MLLKELGIQLERATEDKIAGTTELAKRMALTQRAHSEV